MAKVARRLLLHSEGKIVGGGGGGGGGKIAALLFCEQPPKVPEEVLSFITCSHYSYCFRPCQSFTPSHLTLWLKRTADSPLPDCAYALFYTADNLGKPLVPFGLPTFFGTLDLTTEWKEKRAAVDVGQLIASQNYAFDLSFDVMPEPQPVHYISCRAGIADTCPPPLAQNNRSYALNCYVAWNLPCDCTEKNWILYTWPGYNYKLEGYPL